MKWRKISVIVLVDKLVIIYRNAEERACPKLQE